MYRPYKQMLQWEKEQKLYQLQPDKKQVAVEFAEGRIQALIQEVKDYPDKVQVCWQDQDENELWTELNKSQYLFRYFTKILNGGGIVEAVGKKVDVVIKDGKLRAIFPKCEGDK